MGGGVEIIVGNAIDELRKLDDESVDLCLTSPPYWGLRDYGTATWVGGAPDCDHALRTASPDPKSPGAPRQNGRCPKGEEIWRQVCRCGARRVDDQLGLEPTLAEHLAVMVDLFEEVRRILKPHGSCFINYGDCYATAPNGRSAADTKADGSDDRAFRDKPFSTVGPVERTPKGGFPKAELLARNGDSPPRPRVHGFLKPKDLCMIPNRLAIALQDAGWWVRSEIIWGKTNPMPDSSGSQRPSTAHEKIFWLAKSEDAPVWRARDTGEISFAPNLRERCPLITKPHETGARWIRIGTYYDANAVLQGRAGDEDGATYRGGSYVHGEAGPRKVKGNRRLTRPRGAAPPAVTPRHEGQINHTGLADVETGAGRFLRNYEPAALTVWEMAIEPFKGAHFATFPQELAKRAILAGCPEGGVVLDPFGGAGTTGLVADRLGRSAILIELNPEYAEIARRRIRSHLGRVVCDQPETANDHGPLFGPALEAAE